MLATFVAIQEKNAAVLLLHFFLLFTHFLILLGFDFCKNTIWRKPAPMAHLHK